jgi:hypothetical protein
MLAPRFHSSPISYHDPGNKTHSKAALSVFFCFCLKLLPYDVSIPPPSSPTCHLGHAGPCALRGCPGLFHLRRHLRATSQANGQWLLLPLRGIENLRRLHQNVRIAKIRLPMVGGKLRQATRASTFRNSRRGPSLPAHPARRTRQQLILG